MRMTFAAFLAATTAIALGFLVLPVAAIFVRVPPGDYYIVALTEIEQGEWNDPDFLLQLLIQSHDEIDR